MSEGPDAQDIKLGVLQYHLYIPLDSGLIVKDEQLAAVDNADLMGHVQHHLQLGRQQSRMHDHVRAIAGGLDMALGLRCPSMFALQGCSFFRLECVC